MSSLTFRKSFTAPQFGTHKMGQSLDSVVAKATKLSVQPSPNNDWRQTNLDFNHDGLADAELYEWLDPSGKVTSRSLTDYVDGVNYSLRDTDGDGRIDGFDTNSTKGGITLSDGNGDGKVDVQTVWYASGVQHLFSDQNYDGKADFRQDTRKATSKDAFVPAPTLPGLEAAQLGASLDSLIPATARQISFNEGPNSVTKAWDTNGDWLADITEYQTVDAQRNVTFSQLSVNGTGADGLPVGVTLTDTTHDGKADEVTVAQGSSSVTFADHNKDGKVDWEEIFQNGQTKYLNDTGNDGKPDLVTTAQVLA